MLDFKLVDEAMAFARSVEKKNNDNLPTWAKFEELVRDRLRDEFDPRPKTPKEYYFAYLRVSGLSNAQARERMGLSKEPDADTTKKKSFWKFW